MTATLLVVLIGTPVGLLLGWSVLISAARLQRLDRLHRRTDAARVGLLAALGARASAASAVAAALPDARAALSAAVAATRAAGPPGIGGSERDAVENALGRLLAGIDRGRLPEPLRAELGEAEQRLIVARSVHNDAVRDTLGLRSRRLVRWFRLAGTAPLPSYFEIADAAPDRRPPGPRVIGGTAVRPPR
jgi:hypothetical protein